MSQPDLMPVIREACRWDTAAWFEAYGKIERKSGELVTPVANVYQRKISEVVRWAHENKRPCRIVGLKPRQKGSSTFSTAVGYVRLKAKRGRGVIAGGAHFQGRNLLNMVKVYSENDSLDPKACRVMDEEAIFSNGSRLQRITLANKQAGRSATIQFLLITEEAWLSQDGVANADLVLDGLLKCVPFEEDTIIIEESTANGAVGKFYETWQNGVSFEEFKAGSNSRVRIFSAWFEFEDSRLPPLSEGIRSWTDLSDDEAEYAETWGLGLDQVAWMRWAIREECGGDFDKFQQDYPSDPETCFLRSGRGRFSIEGIQHQEDMAKLSPPTYGVLEIKNGGVIFRPTTKEEARVVRYEQPKVGCKYIQSTDPATGDSQTSGKDPDSNGYGIIRKGFIDHNRKWHEPAVVMKQIMYEDGVRSYNWYDTDIVEEEIYKMATYYGRCPIVVETNKDRGLIELLRLRPDVTIYEREMFNKRTQQTTNALGWETNSKTREMVISTLAAAIRDSCKEGGPAPGEGIKINDPDIIAECKTFVVKANGRSEAASGKHDDSVLFLAIGLQCIEHATAYTEESREEWIPPDLRSSIGTGGVRKGTWG